MSPAPEFTVRQAAWDDDSEAIRGIRTRVFVEEQRIPLELEWDGNDPHCIQVLAEDSGGVAIGTARMFPDGRIGRMAVLPGYRGVGVGRALLEELVQTARHAGLESVLLNAQDSALDFYLKAGFVVDGKGFEEAGIPHHRMERIISGG